MNVKSALKSLIQQAGGAAQFRAQVGIKSRQLLNHYLRTGRVGSPETVAYIRHHYNVDLYPPIPYRPALKTAPAKPRIAKRQNSTGSSQPKGHKSNVAMQ